MQFFSRNFRCQFLQHWIHGAASDKWNLAAVTNLRSDRGKLHTWCHCRLLRSAI